MSTYLCDSNVWVALSLSGHLHHQATRAWFDALENSDVLLFCRSTHQSFLRLLTTATVHAPMGDAALTNEAAWRTYDAFLADDRIVFLDEEPHGLDRWWRTYSQRATASPKLWMDAYLAAFARAEGCQLVTTDSAFRQFSGLNLLLLSEATPA